MLYGGKTSRDLVLLGEMRGLGIAIHLATEDGSLGRRGRVTDELEARLDYWRAAASPRRLRIMACGPREMLWAVGRIAQSCDIECYLSLEEHMACGIGVCLGCAVAAQTRPYRYVCKDGPVFPAREVMVHATPALASPREGGTR
jgi:dihydroorotate dehydrogenase electron transfer subunit